MKPISPVPDQTAQADSSLRSPLLTIRGLSVAFGSTSVLDKLDLQVMHGESLVILGESGCGKTTLLKAIAGLVPVATGEISLSQDSQAQRTKRLSPVIYLDQEPLLFEHLNVSENIGFSLSLQRQPRNVIETTIQQMLQAIDLPEHANKRDWQLSGGQKQRVAFARAVVAQPKLLLLDEPFGSLDGRTRTQMQSLLAELCRRYQLTTIFVTHDVKEALIVGNRFARMESGRLITYPSQTHFMKDKATGIADEIAFWEIRKAESQCDAQSSSGSYYDSNPEEG